MASGRTAARPRGQPYPRPPGRPRRRRGRCRPRWRPPAEPTERPASSPSRGRCAPARSGRRRPVGEHRPVRGHAGDAQARAQLVADRVREIHGQRLGYHGGLRIGPERPVGLGTGLPASLPRTGGQASSRTGWTERRLEPCPGPLEGDSGWPCRQRAPDVDVRGKLGRGRPVLLADACPSWCEVRRAGLDASTAQ
jgi:hypothetical protein